MIRLLIADDSALMRKHLSRIFEGQTDVTVHTCRNGVEVLRELSTFRPNVITLDVNMPEMDGLTCLSRIMVEGPCPVIMVSSLTTRGAMTTLEALAMGAVDFIPKPDGTISLSIDQIQRELLAKVYAAATSRIKKPQPTACTAAVKPVARPQKPKFRVGNDGIVVVGVSTGGPSTLEQILPRLPGSMPWPIVVAQHMPAAFTASFAARLNSVCRLQVREVSGLTLLERGNIYIAQGDADIEVTARSGRKYAASRPASAKYSWHPSVDMLVESVMKVYEPRQVIGVLLTGMGNDGARSMAELKRGGGHTVAESEQTAVIYGMPRELVALGGADEVLPSHMIAGYLTTLFN